MTPVPLSTDLSPSRVAAFQTVHAGWAETPKKILRVEMLLRLSQHTESTFCPVAAYRFIGEGRAGVEISSLFASHVSPSRETHGDISISKRRKWLWIISGKNFGIKGF